MHQLRDIESGEIFNVIKIPRILKPGIELLNGNYKKVNVRPEVVSGDGVPLGVGERMRVSLLSPVFLVGGVDFHFIRLAQVLSQFDIQIIITSKIVSEAIVTLVPDGVDFNCSDKIEDWIWALDRFNPHAILWTNIVQYEAIYNCIKKKPKSIQIYHADSPLPTLNLTVESCTDHIILISDHLKTNRIKIPQTRIYIGIPELNRVSEPEYDIGCFGRVVEGKGIEELIDAARRLPNFSFAVCGDGDLKSKLMMDSPFNVSWLPETTDIEKVLSKFKVLAFCSQSEGCGLVVLEALRMGIPVISTPVGSMPELFDDEHILFIQHSGHLGYGIQYAISNYSLMLKKAEKAKRIISVKLSMKRMGEEYEKLLYKIVGFPLNRYKSLKLNCNINSALPRAIKGYCPNIKVLSTSADFDLNPFFESHNGSQRADIEIIPKGTFSEQMEQVGIPCDSMFDVKDDFIGKVDINFKYSEVKNRISVVIVSFNNEQYIREAICSVLSQDGVDFELLVLDSGSTDRTINIIQEYEDDSRVKCFYTDNKHCAIGRNLLISHSSGEFIAFLDSDDLMLPKSLKRRLELIDGNDFICGHMDHIFDNVRLSDRIYKWSQFNFIMNCEENNFKKIVQEYADVIGQHSLLTRRKVLAEVGGYRNTVTYGCGFEDYDLWLRVMEAGYEIIFFDDSPWALYRDHPNQISKSYGLEIVGAAIQLSKLRRLKNG